LEDAIEAPTTQEGEEKSAQTVKYAVKNFSDLPISKYTLKGITAIPRKLY
jgi:hypothetical protein